MNLCECLENLRAHARPFGSSVDNTTVVLRVKKEGIVISTSSGSIECCDLDYVESGHTACFEFDTWSTACDLLVGHSELSSVFLDGKIRSNGHLTLFFPIMAMFQHHRKSVAPD
ncbi:MAG: hypothetical protein OXG24_08655 [Gammaproteobacteria bacterium]|nr:hypothetical protein [Gammaproteobacteria bacterium]